MEIDVKVVAGASRSEIVGLLGNRLKVRIAAPAEEGKANRALVKLLRERLSAREVEIVAGHSRAEKTVRILGRVRLSDLGLETED